MMEVSEYEGEKKKVTVNTIVELLCSAGYYWTLEYHTHNSQVTPDRGREIWGKM